jgi:hypothetical protein
MSVRLRGVHLTDVYLMGVYLMGAYLMGMHLKGVQSQKPVLMTLLAQFSGRNQVLRASLIPGVR